MYAQCIGAEPSARRSQLGVSFVFAHSGGGKRCVRFSFPKCQQRRRGAKAALRKTGNNDDDWHEACGHCLGRVGEKVVAPFFLRAKHISYPIYALMVTPP